MAEIIEKRRRESSFIAIPNLTPGFFISVRKENIIEFAYNVNMDYVSVFFKRKSDLIHIHYGLTEREDNNSRALTEAELEDLMDQLSKL